jgi:hypothetical protein
VQIMTALNRSSYKVAGGEFRQRFMRHLASWSLS